MNRILNVHGGGGGGGGGQISFTSIQTLIFFLRKDWINIILLNFFIIFSMFTDEKMRKIWIENAFV